MMAKKIKGAKVKKDNGLLYAKRAKCQGCAALCGNTTGYTCSLGYKITFRVVSKTPVQPVPSEPCCKPKDLKELEAAKSKQDAGNK